MLTERSTYRVSSSAVETTTSAVEIALRDIIDGARRWPLWVNLAWRDIRQRYTRTVLGPFWLTLSSAIFLVVFSLIYSKLFNQDIRTYLPYLTTGYLPWMLFSAVVTESCGTFTSEKATISSWQYPYSISVYRLLCRNAIVFFHNIMIVVIIYVVLGLVPSWNMLWLPVSLALFGMNALWVGLLLGTLCARFRDVQPLVASILQITMFVTPIFWRPEMFVHKARAVFIDGNIIYHAVVIIRDPLLGKSPPVVSMAAAAVLAVVGLAVTLVFYGRYRRRLPFWL